MLNLFANKQQLEPDLFSYRRLLGRTGAGAYSLFEGLVSFTQFLMTVSLHVGTGQLLLSAYL